MQTLISHSSKPPKNAFSTLAHFYSAIFGLGNTFSSKVCPGQPNKNISSLGLICLCVTILQLFVDAPRDVSDDGDSTDSEESVYSGLDEEESSEAESFEVQSLRTSPKQCRFPLIKCGRSFVP